MVQINFASREVSCKIVYYGPGRCGKTTNLQIVHAKAPPTSTGEMVSIATKGDRTLYFDFLSLDLGTVAGMRTRFHLYTVPGQVYYDQTRKLVLQGADGIVFVADSAREMMQENIDSLDNLAKNLHENGLDIADIPLVLQWNKRDLPGAMPVEEMQKILNRNNWPAFEAIAVKGNGVFQTLKGIAQQVIRKLNREQGYSDDGQTRRADAQPLSLTAPPPPPPPPAAASRPVAAAHPRPAASAPPPIAAPQAPRSHVAPPSVPKTAPRGGPAAAPAAQKLPAIQPRSQPVPRTAPPAPPPPPPPAAPAAPAQPRLAPPPPGAADGRTPARQPAVSAPAGPAPLPKPVAPGAKPAAPAAPAPVPAPAPVEPSPSAASSTAAAAPKSIGKAFKVKRYPPDPEDIEEGGLAPLPAATPMPPVPAPAPKPAPKSSGSLKSILLLILVLVLCGAALAFYQFVIKGNK